MKILLNDKSDISNGSTRIWVYNLFERFRDLKFDVTLNDWNNYSKYDAVIFGKNTDPKTIFESKEKSPETLFGLINPNDNNKDRLKILELVDFYIVGSIEEKEYYLKYSDNVFIFPLVEEYSSGIKKHVKQDILKICYHGNLEHLDLLSPYIKKALEIYSNERDIELNVIYNINKLGKWKTSIPNVKINHIQWELKSIQKEIKKSDIGIVPGLTLIEPEDREKFIKLSNEKYGFKNRFKNDYLIRFKNKSNGGRSFVFHQLGIPVISDFIPSCFHILADPNCGYLAHYSEGWLKALRALGNFPKRREDIANNAFRRFNELYDPLLWAKDLFENINSLKK